MAERVAPRSRDDVGGQRSYSNSYSLFPDLLLFTSVASLSLRSDRPPVHVQWQTIALSNTLEIQEAIDVVIAIAAILIFRMVSLFPYPLQHRCLYIACLQTAKLVYFQNCLLVRESLYTLVSLANPKNGKYTPPAANFGFS